MSNEIKVKEVYSMEEGAITAMVKESDYKALQERCKKLEVALGSAISDMDAVLNDPDVTNVFKCHYDFDYLNHMEKILESGNEL